MVKMIDICDASVLNGALFEKVDIRSINAENIKCLGKTDSNSYTVIFFTTGENIYTTESIKTIEARINGLHNK